MGQYYYIANLDKKEYLHPHHCGDGLKLMEFGLSSCGTMSCLAILLADGNGRGGGDLFSDNPIIGSWAGDRIVITGDYADVGRFGALKGQTLMFVIDNGDWRNISALALEALADDSQEVRDHIRAQWGQQQ